MHMRLQSEWTLEQCHLTWLKTCLPEFLALHNPTERAGMGPSATIIWRASYSRFKTLITHLFGALFCNLRQYIWEKSLISQGALKAVSGSQRKVLLSFCAKIWKKIGARLNLSFSRIAQKYELKMTRHFMVERFFSKITSTPLSSQSWARFMIKTRQDIGEMTTLKLISLMVLRKWGFLFI